jgi:hypothetical protein
MRTSISILSLAIFACATPTTSPEPIDWQAANERWSVHVVTVDPDGDERVTRIWLAMVGDETMLRTNDSRWWQNIVRNSKCSLRLDRTDYALYTDPVVAPEERVRIDEAFLEKYGWMERMLFPQDRGETHENYARLRQAVVP